MQYTQGEMRSQEEDIGKDHMGEEGEKIELAMCAESRAIWPKIIGRDRKREG